MKKLIAIIAAAVSFTAFTSEAHAEHGCGTRTFVGYDSCGNPVYRVRYVADYDCDGCPIYGYRREVVRRHHHESSHGHGHHRHGIDFRGHRGSISIDFGRRGCR